MIQGPVPPLPPDFVPPPLDLRSVCITLYFSYRTLIAAITATLAASDSSSLIASTIKFFREVITDVFAFSLRYLLSTITEALNI